MFEYSGVGEGVTVLAQPGTGRCQRERAIDVGPDTQPAESISTDTRDADDDDVYHLQHDAVSRFGDTKYDLDSESEYIERPVKLADTITGVSVVTQEQIRRRTQRRRKPSPSGAEDEIVAHSERIVAFALSCVKRMQRVGSLALWDRIIFRISIVATVTTSPMCPHYSLMLLQRQQQTGARPRIIERSPVALAR